MSGTPRDTRNDAPDSLPSVLCWAVGVLVGYPLLVLWAGAGFVFPTAWGLWLAAVLVLLAAGSLYEAMGGVPIRMFQRVG